MEAIEFFDCDCAVGMRSVVNPGSFYRKEDLLRKMKYYGIGKALVYHSLAREYHPVAGNRALEEEIGEHECLIPAWAVMPHHTAEFPDPDTLKTQLKSKGIRAVRMFPAAHEQNYSTAGWNCGELFEMLEDCRIPLFLGFNPAGWNELYEICSSYPEMRIVLTDIDYRVDRNLYPLLEKFPHLVIVTIGYKVHHGIEEICGRFGAERLVFGSGMPVYSGGSAVSMIRYARISEKEKRIIAGENLTKLLEGVRW